MRLDMRDVIELSSSPEPAPRAAPSRKRARTPLFLPDDLDPPNFGLEDEYEFVDLRAKKKRRSDAVSEPVAGTSRPNPSTKLMPQTASPHDLEPIDVDEFMSVRKEDRWLAQVCEMIPDVSPDYVCELLDKHKSAYPTDAVEFVVQTLLEDKSYPKVDKGKGKNKALASDEVDYTSTVRNMAYPESYRTATYSQLLDDFPNSSETHINAAYEKCKKLYVPAYLRLEELQRTGQLPDSRRKRPPKKGKSRATEDVHFLLEFSWFCDKRRREKEQHDMALAQQLVEEEESADIECGCCFDTYPFSKTVQCPEAHLFCADCVVGYAESKLGEQNHLIPCMSQAGDGCKAHFGDSELRRVLPAKLLELYERVRQRRDVEAADLEDMEECPFCDFKMIFEVDADTDKLFVCRNPSCEQISCRKCKKEDHLPKSCAEVVEDKKLHGKHAVEEAMTAALMRICPNPKCNKSFVKESGCNKMSCPHCGTLSCYVCRQKVTGYEHFHRTPAGQNPAVPAVAGSKTATCPLWDAVDQRHHDEVAEAARKAQAAYKEDHPDADDADLNVDLPPAPPPGQNPHGIHLNPALLANDPLAHMQQMNAMVQQAIAAQRARLPVNHDYALFNGGVGRGVLAARRGRLPVVPPPPVPAAGPAARTRARRAVAPPKAGPSRARKRKT